MLTKGVCGTANIATPVELQLFLRTSSRTDLNVIARSNRSGESARYRVERRRIAGAKVTQNLSRCYTCVCFHEKWGLEAWVRECIVDQEYVMHTHWVELRCREFCDPGWDYVVRISMPHRKPSTIRYRLVFLRVPRSDNFKKYP